MDSLQCVIGREVDIYVAVGYGRDMAARVGFDSIDRTRIEIAILELARNILAHATRGELIIELVEQDARRGIAIIASDNGPGIENINLAMQDGYSTKKTLGAGLPGVKRLMDDFQIDSTLGVGTRVRAVKWLSARQTGRRL